MPAWREARRSGRQACQEQVRQRTGSRTKKRAIPHYTFDGDDPQCVICKTRTGRFTTGHLVVTGPVWKCGKAKCKKQYRKEKAWEASP
jgi:hypothetical protein